MKILAGKTANSGELVRWPSAISFVAMHLQCAAHGLAVFFHGFRLAGNTVEVSGPLELVGRRPEAGFVKEAASNVVADVRFLFRGADCPECLFVQHCGVVPVVLPLVDLGQDQEQLTTIG